MVACYYHFTSKGHILGQKRFETFQCWNLSQFVSNKKLRGIQAKNQGKDFKSICRYVITLTRIFPPPNQISRSSYAITRYIKCVKLSTSFKKAFSSVTFCHSHTCDGGFMCTSVNCTPSTPFCTARFGGSPIVGS